jgi:hypothetical protein
MIIWCTFRLFLLKWSPFCNLRYGVSFWENLVANIPRATRDIRDTMLVKQKYTYMDHQTTRNIVRGLGGSQRYEQWCNWEADHHGTILYMLCEKTERQTCMYSLLREWSFRFSPTEVLVCAQKCFSFVTTEKGKELYPLLVEIGIIQNQNRLYRALEFETKLEKKRAPHHTNSEHHAISRSSSFGLSRPPSGVQFCSSSHHQ